MEEIKKAIEVLKEDAEQCEYRVFCLPNSKIKTLPLREEKIKNYKLAISVLEKQLNNGWIPVSERLPEAETEVEISIKRIRDKDIYYFTVRGFYEDGSIWSEDSPYNWEFDNTIHELDEQRDDFKIPIGWWEESTYADEYGVYSIDDFVTAWRLLPQPYKEDNL